MQPSRPSPICFAEVENICVDFNKKCKLSKMYFYPTGGLLYHYYSDVFGFPLPDDTECTTKKPMLSTPDIDGYFMILPNKINVKTLRKQDACYTHKIALEAIEEALPLFKDSPMYDNLDMLKYQIEENMETFKKEDKNDFPDDFDLKKKSLCKFDVHVNIVRKPLYNIKDGDFRSNGFFFGSNGTELVLSRWKNVLNYPHVIIIDPYAHLFDQLFTLFIRNTGNNKKVIEKIKYGKNLSNLYKRIIKMNKLKMQKTAFRIKVLCKNVFPRLTIRQLFGFMRYRHFEGAFEVFDVVYQEESKRLKQEKNTFLNAYGKLTVVEFCDNVLKEMELVCDSLYDIYSSKLYKLKF